jgi:hypothetical protein
MSSPIVEQLKALPVAERMQQTRKIREEMIGYLNERISELQRERIEMDSQYDEAIAEIQAELIGYGAANVRPPSDAGIKAYNYLKEHAGERIQSGDLMRAIRCEGAVAAIVLAPFVEDRRVQIAGEKKGRVYWVESEPS